MSLFLLQTGGIAIIAVVLWTIIKPLVIKSPLSDLPGPPKESFWLGNFLQIFNRKGWDFNEEIAKKFGGAIRTFGLFGRDQLYTFDPLALHHIFVKNQYVYEETEVFLLQNQLVFGCSLLSTLGEHHRKQRKMLNPVFSLSHMRGLIPIFYPIAHQLREVLSKEVQKGEKDINIMKWVSRAALEYIGQGGLGYSFDALDETKKNTYSEMVRMLGPIRFSLSVAMQALPVLMKLGPPAFRRRLLDLLPSKLVHKARDIVDVMDAKAREIYDKKKEALARGDEAVLNQVGRGKDILSLLLRANMDAEESEKLPEAEVLGQMGTFIHAGHETTTSAICRTLHLLSLHPDVQDKLRTEVSEARTTHGDLDYDILMGLPYLDAVCRETLRVHPPVPTLIRVTKQDIVLPLAWPVKSVDGKREVTSIPLKKDTNVIISIINANRSKEIWGPDAEEWKPERWLSPLPDSVAKAHLPGVYASMMTFIGGGRACIGFKFAEMELKLVLSMLLEMFVFKPGSHEIYWNMGGLQTPVIKGSTDHAPQLPMDISFVECN